MRRILVAALAAMIMMVGAGPAHAESETLHFGSRSQLAEAFFSSTDPSGCVITNVLVVASDGTIKTGSGGPAAESVAFAFVSQFDVCTETVLLEANGTAVLAPEEFQIDRLDAATLATTIEMFDFVSGTSFVADVDIAWTGTGATVTEKAHFQTKSDGFKVNSKFFGTFRQATASGAVTDGGTNLTPDAAVSAQLGSVKTGELTITHE